MTDKYTADEQWDNGEFEVFDTADELMEALGGAEDDMSEMPERIGAYITEYTSQEWYELFYDEPVGEGDVEYIRADIAVKRIADAEFSYEELLEDAKQFAAIMNHQTDTIEQKDAEIARLENIIADMSAREVDEPLPRMPTRRLTLRGTIAYDDPDIDMLAAEERTDG
jgi:hypothetical protein